MTHLTTEEIEAGMAHVLASPRDHGRLEMIVIRPAGNERAVLEEAVCTIDGGVEGDYWAKRSSCHREYGRPNLDQQITLMNARYLDLIAGSRDRWPLAGDQLIVDLYLGQDHLTAGDRLRIGEVVLEVTPCPHNGCGKFRDRFGRDAVRFANSPRGKELRLRGIYVRVVEEGVVRVGDIVTRLSARPVDSPAQVMDTSFWAEGPDRLRKGMKSKRRELDRLIRELQQTSSEDARREIDARIRALLEGEDPSDEDVARSLFLRGPESSDH